MKPRPPLTISYDHVRSWYLVTFASGKFRAYASLPTLLGFLTDYYSK